MTSSLPPHPITVPRLSARERILRFRRLRKDSQAWALLRAKSAPFILGFLQELFSQESEVSVAEARAALDAQLADRTTAEGDSEGGVSSSATLAAWVRASYIREQDGKYLMTDACTSAIKYAESLERRELSATATHLRVVQDSVDDLLFQLNADPTERAEILLERMKQLQLEYEQVLAGDFKLPSKPEQREAMRHILSTARSLSGDFRLLEDDYRQRSQELREMMLSEADSRGAVIEKALDHEDRLKETQAGQAFEGFYAMLSDTDLRREFRAKVKRLLETPAGEHLSDSERRFLSNLTGELMQESQRVLRRRRRSAEALSGWVKVSSVVDRKEIDRLLATARLLALEIRKREDINPVTRTNLVIDTGGALLYSPDALRLTDAKAVTFDTEVVQNDVDTAVSDAEVAKMARFQILALARRLATSLKPGVPESLGQLTQRVPLRGGLQEVIGAFRIAEAVGGSAADMREDIYFLDTDGHLCRANVPYVIICTDDFPDDLRDLEL